MWRTVERGFLLMLLNVHDYSDVYIYYLLHVKQWSNLVKKKSYSVQQQNFTSILKPASKQRLIKARSEVMKGGGDVAATYFYWHRCFPGEWVSEWVSHGEVWVNWQNNVIGDSDMKTDRQRDSAWRPSGHPSLSGRLITFLPLYMSSLPPSIPPSSAVVLLLWCFHVFLMLLQ